MKENQEKIQAVLKHLEELLGHEAKRGTLSSVSGGCIHAAYECQFGRRWVFFKVSSDRGVLEAEADGLKALHSQSIKRETGQVCFYIPEVFDLWTQGSDAVLAMEHLRLGSRGNYADMGRALAQLHAQQDLSFGWPEDNYLGATRQPRGQSEDWLECFATYRFGFMLTLMEAKGYDVELCSQVLARLPDFFWGYRPFPSLLHGDLWSGNAGFCAGGSPTCFDPAVLIGDREFDLAMTELFGGFGSDFYKAYDEVLPIDKGYNRRRALYQLYHIMNHAVLFGGSYVGQARAMASELLKT